MRRVENRRTMLAMKLLFIADPLDTFKVYKDSTFAMMREAAGRGHALFACEPQDLFWEQGQRVQARAMPVTLTGLFTDGWYETQDHQVCELAAFDAVLMRKDPPFDSEYFYATHLLGQAQREGARVFNDPAALREHPEKLAIMEFAHFCAPTLVSRDPQRLRAFHARHGDVIFKPLDGMGGAGIFRVGPDGRNLGAILETLGHNGQRSLMAQKYLAAIEQGDKRILLIDGQPVPYCLARIPQGGEVRGNLAAGGKGVAQPLSPRDLEIAHALGPVLARRGLLLVGLDVIGEQLTEINVTSPTCFREITDQTGLDVAAIWQDALEQRARRTSMA
jgi:glutathione synthase